MPQMSQVLRERAIGMLRTSLHVYVYNIFAFQDKVSLGNLLTVLQRYLVTF